MKSDVKRILSLSLFLAVLGLVCAGLLACINHITAPIIEENRMKELEKQLEIINIKEPTIVDCELVKGVDAVYTGVYNKGLSDETECYVIQVTVKNDYTQITSVVAISRSSGKIVALAPFSGDPSFTTHGKNGAFENNDFGLVGSGSSSINTAFENVAGATKSSESIKTAAKLAFEQYELLNSNVESERTYANDGTYLAYKLGINNNSPEVTFVTVTIRNDVLVHINIDTVQGTNVASVNGEGETVYTVSFDKETKREKGYGYHMHWYTYAGIVGYANASEEGYIAWLKENNKLEWFEQAALIAKAYENGQDIVVNSSGKFDNVASVSISDAAYVQTLKQLEVFKENIGLYMADGKYVAYKLSVNKNAPELIFVTITIKNDKIVDVEIDTIQGTNVSSKDSKGEDVFTAAFNSQSKRELGYAYHMHWNLYKAAVGEDNTSEEGYIAWLKENNKLEWFEQMDILEDKILNGDINNISINQNNKFENIAGVSVSDYGYIELVKEAVQYAIDGVVKSITTNEDDLIIATANIDKNGQLSDVVLDTITGNVSAEGTFSWNDKSKNELGYLYHMHWYTYAGIVGFANATEEGYIEWLKENNKLEWFEQAALIVKAWEKDHSLVANNGKFDTISGVSISDALYIETLNKLLEGKE